jgi:hypothetical protein
VTKLLKANAGVGATPDDRHGGLLLAEPCDLVDDATGSLLAGYRRLHRDEADGFLETCRRIKYGTGARTLGLVATARIFGYQPRLALRRDFCAQATLAQEQPEENAALVQMARAVEGAYEDANPALYRDHVVQTATRAARFALVERGAFTSGIVNENNPLKYHRDRGNYPDAWSGMVAVRTTGAHGGHLVLPEYGVRFDIAHGTLLLFDGQSIVHGVSPIRLADPKADRRYTAVYYSMRGLWKCLTEEQELARIRRLRTEREGRPRGAAAKGGGR